MNKFLAVIWIFIVFGWATDSLMKDIERGHDALGAPPWFSAIIKLGLVCWIGAAIWRGQTRGLRP